METYLGRHSAPWNRGKLFGQKAPLKPREIWAIRVRLQLGHTKLESTVRYLGIEVDDALDSAEQTDA